MADDNWKERIGMEINYSSDDEEKQALLPNITSLINAYLMIILRTKALFTTETKVLTCSWVQGLCVAPYVCLQQLLGDIDGIRNSFLAKPFLN